MFRRKKPSTHGFDDGREAVGTGATCPSMLATLVKVLATKQSFSLAFLPSFLFSALTCFGSAGGEAGHFLGF